MSKRFLVRVEFEMNDHPAYYEKDSQDLHPATIIYQIVRDELMQMNEADGTDLTINSLVVIEKS